MSDDYSLDSDRLEREHTEPVVGPRNRIRCDLSFINDCISNCIYIQLVNGSISDNCRNCSRSRCAAMYVGLLVTGVFSVSPSSYSCMHYVYISFRSFLGYSNSSTFYRTLRIIVLLLISCLIASARPEKMAASSNEENTFQDVSDSSNKFCNSFYRTVAVETEGNIVSSPLSAHTILSLVAHGARGKTAEEMKVGLSLPGTDLPIHSGFKSLLSALNNITEVELSIANTMYIQEGVSIVPEFLSVGSEFFHSDTPTVDFKNNVAAVKQINSWVEEKTKNKIKDIVTADDVHEDTKLILVNAIYFKGHWEKQFDPRFTESRLFHVTKDNKKHIPTMFKKSEYPHAELPGLNAKVIEIPYVNDKLSMLIILPNEIDGLRSLEENFDWESIEKVHRVSSKIELYLPRFKLETTLDLQETLQKIGMRLMFSDWADFSGMAHTALKVGKVMQKAFIEVNEEGSEAAAATVVQMRLRRMITPPETFEVDRPFMFAIKHKPSNIPLFVGSVRDIEIPPARDEL